LLAYDQNRRILEDIAKIANQRNDYQIIERGELKIAVLRLFLWKTWFKIIESPIV
jgi:hypothetical protein